MAAAGFEKSRVLYGLPDALLTTGPLYICEGATDCWAIGPGAVAIFGKSASDKQRSLIEQHFSHRPIVIFPDRGAEAEAVDLRTYLQRRRDPTTTPPVVIAELPEHRDDPGECTRDEILGAAATALDVPGNEVAYASEIDIVNGRRHYLSERGADRVGSHVAVVYSTGSAGRANAALVGGDGKLRYVTPCTERFFLSLAPKPRVYHNAVTSRLRELQIGLPAPTAFEDLRVAGHLLDENCSCDLPDLCRRYVDEGSDGANGQDQLLPSASESDRRTSSDAIRLRRLWDEGQLLERLDQQDLRYVYDEIELPVADVTAAMMDNGIGVDAEWLQEHRDRWATEVEDLRREIESHSRHPVNVDDPASVSGLLQDLGLPLADATADAKCRTDKQTLLRIRDAHPVVRKILNYRRHKARHEWADRLLRKTHPRTGRLHFRLDPLGTVTGRFSCEDPNLQGLPADMREAFIPAPGLVLVEADFSQIELRVLAHISGDSRLLKAYRLDQADLHRKTAAAVFKISEKAVTAQQRALGKKVNFAIIYGMTPHGLAHDMNVDEDTARSFIQRFFEAYPQADRWIWACKREAESCGHVRSLYGRRRCLPNAQSETRADLERALRQATNFVIQGTAADINKMALIRLHKALPDDCRMLLTVHDSVLIEAPANRGCEVVPLIRQVMEESPPDFSVPLKVDVHVGQNWGKCK
jgi:DNA polymerase I-like protein with 3'-5' exonuclease and polymerase domains